MANDTNELREYEALKAAREMAAKDTNAALERVAKELARQQREKGSAQPSQAAAAGS